MCLYHSSPHSGECGGVSETIGDTLRHDGKSLFKLVCSNFEQRSLGAVHLSQHILNDQLSRCHDQNGLDGSCGVVETSVGCGFRT